MKGYYHIVTYGCQMNIHESEKLAGVLEKMGYISTDNINIANVVVFNTCCIREAAEQKAFGNIGALKPLKKKNPDLIVAVCGCMTQQKEKAEELKKTFPFVNIIFGTHNIYKFEEYLTEFQKTHKRILDVWGKDKDCVLPEEVDSVRTSGYNAWVNIMYGCNNFCSYCIVPYVRGRERSRDFNEIVVECKKLISEGYKTITLLGQNVNSYGNDLHNENYTFAKLLDTVAKIEGDFELHFMTSHPKDLTSEVIDVIRDNENISKAIHLPVQSGSNRILKLMNRHYTKQHYLDLVKEIYEKIPNAKLSTDIIVGFPTETDEDYNETRELVKQVRYNNIFAFMYSKRSGTKAEVMEDQVPMEVKNFRVNDLLNLQKQITKDSVKNSVGTTEKCLIVEKLENGVLAKTDSGRTIVILNEDDASMRFCKVKITKLEKNQLYGEII